jgi:predicted PurR-regulated permease PerM
VIGPNPDRRSRIVTTEPYRIDISGRTIVKVLCAALVVWLWMRLWQWVLLLIVAAFLAVGLDPAVGWLEARGIRRAYGAVLTVLVLAGGILAFTYIAGAELADQGKVVVKRFAEVQQDIGDRIPPALKNALPKAEGADNRPVAYLVRVGQSIVNAVVSISVAFILTIYLLVDGRRTYQWLVAFAPRSERPRVHRTALESRRAIRAYVVGNAITSGLAAVTAYVFLTILNVPAALLLALLTGLFDFIPVLGIILSAVPMFVLAMTVSTTAAVLTIVFNAAYNAIENYYISPKVYGREMRLSSLAVILAFAVGAEVAGIVGALIALPFAAMYPTIEHIWLAGRLGPEVPDAHRRIEQMPEH